MLSLEKFEEHLRATCGSERTVMAYVADSRAFVRFLDGRPPDIDAVEAWVSGLNHGTNRPQTIQRKMAAVRRFLGYAARFGDGAAASSLLILRDYKVSPAVRQADVRQVRAVTREEFAALRTKADARMRALLAAAWWTGARVSEILGDPLTHIPPLTIADGLRLVRAGHTVTRGKGGKIRVLVLPTSGREDMRAYVEVRQADVLFDITPQGLNAWLHRAGFPGGLHAFRHSFRSRLRQAGVSPEMQARLMGHGPRSVTEGYGPAEVAELLEAVERLT